jgi:hypothetical protein
MTRAFAENIWKPNLEAGRQNAERKRFNPGNQTLLTGGVDISKLFKHTSVQYGDTNQKKLGLQTHVT